VASVREVADIVDLRTDGCPNRALQQGDVAVDRAVESVMQLGDSRLQGSHALTQFLVSHGFVPSLGGLNAAISTSVKHNRWVRERGSATAPSHARASSSVTPSVGSPIDVGAHSAQ